VYEDDDSDDIDRKHNGSNSVFVTLPFTHQEEVFNTDRNQDGLRTVLKPHERGRMLSC